VAGGSLPHSLPLAGFFALELPMTTKNENAAGKPALTLLTTVKAIEAGIVSIHTAGQALQTHMHLVACSVLQHVGKHKDTRVLMKLINAMPDMSRKNSLIQWFETFGNVKYSTEGKTFVLVKDKPIKLGTAIEKPFWKFKATEGVVYQPIDVAALVAQTIAKLTKDAEKTKRDHTGLINALKAGMETEIAF
jgi:hypothetical protein